MATDGPMSIESQLAEMRSILLDLRNEVQSLRAGPPATRTAYSVEEAAKLLQRAPYTVRQWCLDGRINATKRAERRGGAEVWSVPAGEVERYRNEGLLPRVPVQRAG